MPKIQEVSLFNSTGDTATGDEVDYEETIPAGEGILQPSSSQNAATVQSSAPSVWDPNFNPMDFVEKELNMVGDSSRFSDTSAEDI
ncbi:hypothetical protein A2U01_0068427 [Trifolium medium]|uniref:Uncharacterized protein n=1 Tax=Trifolium medium TaxID=97028 RepID=A0A392SH52_9FABA|nr:hypothetical protein [Trifolium medium]